MGALLAGSRWVSATAPGYVESEPMLLLLLLLLLLPASWRREKGSLVRRL
jgi:hypothetical protein